MRRQYGWLDGDIPIPPSGIDVTHRLSPLNQRLRQAFIEGAVDDSRRRLGRGLTAEELERVLWHYPGDAIERWSSGTDDERGDADV